MKMKKYKHWSQLQKAWIYTDSFAEANNASYFAQKPYYKRITGKYIEQSIPDTLDLSNTDTFHNHESKGDRRVREDKVSRGRRVKA